MLVEPTRVHASRGRWIGGLLVGLLGIATLSLIASLNPGSPQPAAPSQPTTAAVLGTPRPPFVTLAARPAELEVRLVSGSLLELDGWVPGQFGWAAVDVLDGERRLGGPAMRVDPDGTFSGTVDLSSWGATVDRMIVRLSGLNDVQLYAVPLLTVLVPAEATLSPLSHAGWAAPR